MKSVFAAAALMAGTAPAAANLVQNGSFDAPGGTQAQWLYGAGNTALTGWTIEENGGFPLIWYYPPGTADNNATTAMVAGPGNGHNNGFTLSPDGGAMVAIDGAPEWRAGISQQISGLTAGATYNLSFYWAGAQQNGGQFNLPTTNKGLTVGFGDSTQSTSTVSGPAQSFQGWFTSSFDFVATNATQKLSFLATGLPTGQPPFVLLDGVSLSFVSSPAGVPEPSSWIMLIAGFGVTGMAARRRRTAEA